MGCVASALWWDLGRLPRPQRWHLLACRPTWQERDLCHPVAASFGPTAVFLPSGMKIEPSILFVLMNDSQAAVCLEDKAPAAGCRVEAQGPAERLCRTQAQGRARKATAHRGKRFDVCVPQFPHLSEGSVCLTGVSKASGGIT